MKIMYISITLTNCYFYVSSEWGMEREIQNINILAINRDNSSRQMLNFQNGNTLFFENK